MKGEPLPPYEEINPNWDRDLVKFGWAPGSYICKCYTCGNSHWADKRASRCINCANKALEESENK